MERSTQGQPTEHSLAQRVAAVELQLVLAFTAQGTESVHEEISVIIGRVDARIELASRHLIRAVVVPFELREYVAREELPVVAVAFAQRELQARDLALRLWRRHVGASEGTHRLAERALRRVADEVLARHVVEEVLNRAPQPPIGDLDAYRRMRHPLVLEATG